MTPPSSLAVSLSTAVVTTGEGDTAFLVRVMESVSSTVLAVAEAGNLPGRAAINLPVFSEVAELEIAEAGNRPGMLMPPMALLGFEIAGGGEKLCAIIDGGYLPGRSLITRPMLSLATKVTDAGYLPGSATIISEKDVPGCKSSSSSNTVANEGTDCCCCDVSRIQRSIRSIRSSMLSSDILAAMLELLTFLVVRRKVGQVAADGCIVV